MIFIVLRFVVFGLCFFIFYCLRKNSVCFSHRRDALRAFVLATVITTLLTLVPIENAFATFSSPENAFRYSNFGTIQQVVAGQKADFVVAKNGEKSIYAIFPKTDKGWKLSRWLDLELTTSVITEETTVSVYRYKNTEDYYVTVFGNNGGVLSVSDSRNSEFVSLACANAALNQTFYTYYAYASALDNYYVLTVNNKPIQLWS